jgi:hypothetical protein
MSAKQNDVLNMREVLGALVRNWLLLWRSILISQPADESVEILIRLQQSVICSICQDIMYTPFTTECGHSFCYDVCACGGLRHKF